MTNYTVEIIDTKQLNDGQIAFCARCNGDPTTDSWATVTIDPQLSSDELDTLLAKTIEAHQKRVASLYAARTVVANKAKAHKGKKTTIAL